MSPMVKSNDIPINLQGLSSIDDIISAIQSIGKEYADDPNTNHHGIREYHQRVRGLVNDSGYQKAIGSAGAPFLKMEQPNCATLTYGGMIESYVGAARKAHKG